MRDAGWETMKSIGLNAEPRGSAGFRRPRTVRACAGRPRLVRTSAVRPAVFLDRDGTLIVDKPYNANPDDIELYPDTRFALDQLARAGYLLVVVTNQSGVARGYFDEAAVIAMHARLDDLLDPSDQIILAYYYCPHHAAGSIPDLAIPCPCRKPEPGMLRRAAEDWGIDLSRSWMIGDMESDVEAGWAAGCRSVLLRGPRGARGGLRATSLGEAVQIISERDAVERRDEAAKRRVTRRG